MVGVQVDQGRGGSSSNEPAPAASTGTQHLQVTSENVVELAVTFRRVAQRYNQAMTHLERNLTLQDPWLDDPFSKWAQDEFNDYFVHGENSVTKTITQLRQQYTDMYHALQKIAEQYGLTDELNKQLMNYQGPAT